jgi:hypothetical protein
VYFCLYAGKSGYLGRAAAHPESLELPSTVKESRVVPDWLESTDTLPIAEWP